MLYFFNITVANPEGVRGVQTNPRLSLNYFIFMGNFRKKWSDCTNRTPLSLFEPPIQKSWIRPCIKLWNVHLLQIQYDILCLLARNGREKTQENNYRVYNLRIVFYIFDKYFNIDKCSKHHTILIPNKIFQNHETPEIHDYTVHSSVNSVFNTIQ